MKANGASYFFSFYCANKADTDRGNQGTKRFKNRGFVKDLAYAIVKQNRSNGGMSAATNKVQDSHGSVPRVMAVGFLSEGYYWH